VTTEDLSPDERNEVQVWFLRSYAARKRRQEYGRRYPRPHGLARLDPESRRIISTEGGRAVQESGRGHRFTPEEGKAAARKVRIRTSP
jgi:hypothetical protein